MNPTDYTPPSQWIIVDDDFGRVFDADPDFVDELVFAVGLTNSLSSKGRLVPQWN